MGGGPNWSLGKMQMIAPTSLTGMTDIPVMQGGAAAPVAPVAAADTPSAGHFRDDRSERGQTVPHPPFPRPDPDRPAGPPPAFDTTPLDLVRERRLVLAQQFWRSSLTEVTTDPAPHSLDIAI